ADADEFRSPTVEGVRAHEAADLLVAGADALDQAGEPGLPIVAECGEPHEPIETEVVGGDQRADPADIPGFALEPVLPPPIVRRGALVVGPSVGGAVVAGPPVVVGPSAVVAGLSVVVGVRTDWSGVDPPFDDDLVPRLGHRT